MSPRVFAIVCFGVCLAGCAETKRTVRVAAVRYTDDEAHELGQRPLCFAPASPDLGLAARSEQGKRIELCAYVARKRSLRVQDGDDCLVTKLQWKVEKVAATSDCNSYQTFSMPKPLVHTNCMSQPVVQKTLKLIVMDADGEVLSEAISARIDENRVLSATDAYALCSAALADFPRPFERRTTEIELP